MKTRNRIALSSLLASLGVPPGRGGRSPSKRRGSANRSRSRPGTFWTIPLAAVWGSARTSGSVLMGAHGTPACSSRSSHSACGRVLSTSSISASKTFLWAKRSALVRKRGSAAHSG